MPTFNFKNINIDFTVIGKGSAIVLLHGFLENKEMWNDIIPSLPKNRRYISIDLLGHGQTENLGYVHTMEEQASMIRALLKSLNIRKVTFIGHSMGGYIALAFADIFPKNTKGICLLNSTAYPDNSAKKASRDRAIEAVKKTHKMFIRISIPMLFSEENKIPLKKEIGTVTKEALKTSKQGVIASLEGMKIREDRTHILQNDSIKKLIILGKNDSVLLIDKHQNQVKDTNTKLVVLNQGHMSHIENKLEVQQTLKEFINL